MMWHAVRMRSSRSLNARNPLAWDHCHNLSTGTSMNRLILFTLSLCSVSLLTTEANAQYGAAPSCRSQSTYGGYNNYSGGYGNSGPGYAPSPVYSGYQQPLFNSGWNSPVSGGGYSSQYGTYGQSYGYSGTRSVYDPIHGDYHTVPNQSRTYTQPQWNNFQAPRQQHNHHTSNSNRWGY